MTSVVPHYRHTFREYLLIEENSPNVKHEYLDGAIYAMAGSTPEHAALVSELMMKLGAMARGRCRVFGSDLGVRVVASDLATFPDVTVVYGPIERDSVSKIHYLNPSIICEVLSPSTESYDRGEKREYYQRLESLREYVILAQDRPHAEKWSRGADGRWTHEEIAPDGNIVFDALGASINLADLYRDAAL